MWKLYLKLSHNKRCFAIKVLALVKKGRLYLRFIIAAALLALAAVPSATPAFANNKSTKATGKGSLSEVVA